MASPLSIRWPSLPEISLYLFISGSDSQRIESGDAIAEELAYVAVSYTHLDVYKRQPKKLHL